MVFVKELVPAESKQDVASFVGQNWMWMIRKLTNGAGRRQPLSRMQVSVHYEVMLLVTSITKDGKDTKPTPRKTEKEEVSSLHGAETKPASFNEHAKLVYQRSRGKSR